MSEDKNIEEQPEDDKPPKTDDSEKSAEGNLFSSEENKIVAEETQPQTLNPQPLTSDMEVHHHGHVHEKKKWKEYLFQFLMLFLAVFCGFLAEYQLEHYIERERAEELAKTLYIEMRSDSANLNNKVNNRKDKEGHLQYLAQYFQDSNLINLPREFYPRFTWGLFQTSYILFEPNDGILEQLKNSGSLRYFKNIEIQKAVGDFSVAVKNLRTRNERELHLLAELNRNFLLNHFDHSWLNKISNNGERSSIEALKKYATDNYTIPASILNVQVIDRTAIVNSLNYNLIVVRSTRNVQMHEYQKASNYLIKLIREEYLLKTE